jgi:replicative DNA helicase
LKESGDLEAHAHTVILNFRPIEKKDEETMETFTGDDEIIIGKQRFGPIGIVPVWYNSDTLSFERRR